MVENTFPPLEENPLRDHDIDFYMPGSPKMGLLINSFKNYSKMNCVKEKYTNKGPS